MKFGVVVFPGSNCDHDTYYAITETLGEQAAYLWHKDHDLQNSDVIILPGGFSYGDYLRSGAIARFSPIMTEVVAHAKRGGPVLCICNGFQIACEAGLLPGALLRNANLQFLGTTLKVRVENADTMYTNRYEAGQVLALPVAHGDGRYTADEATLDRLEGDGRVVFRYVGEVNQPGVVNANGSMRAIAGIINAEGNVMGLMPHPERALSAAVGSTDGIGMFESMLARVAV